MIPASSVATRVSIRVKAETETLLTVRVQAIERAEERRPRVRVQHIGWTGNASVGGPGVGQRAGDECALATGELKAINVDVAVSRGIVENEIQANVIVAE